MTGELVPLEWHCEKRKVSELIPWDQNPRQMTEKQVEDLQDSLRKLNLIDIPAINTDGILIGGHQRCKTLQILGRGDEIIDVRVPNRKLTEDEFQEANIRLNKNVGEWDVDMLASFDTGFLLDTGFTDKELTDMFQIELHNFKEPGGKDPKGEKDDKNKCPKCGYEW